MHFYFPIVLQSDGFEKHFAAQIYNYGKQVIINLVRAAKLTVKGGTRRTRVLQD